MWRNSVVKKVTKKKVAKKKVAKKAAPVAATPKSVGTAIGSRQTKTQILQAVAEITGLDRKQVAAVYTATGELIARHMKPRGSGEFTIPDTGVKIRRVIKPARKARMGRNPATGEVVKIAAKPKSKAIRVAALKALKETIA